eukprot:TRINITY_DN9383_c0_g1_i1.p1 TRINITY_DN9383_c0_g1~~TRINITY_DN9383_c0_g1_i1.p1  ORF type:complete len:230 (-),score=33.55 TRINITY_DN9383_c0_g1_i1:114-803(-)
MSGLVNVINLYKEIRNINKKNIFNGEASVEPISDLDPLQLRVLLTPKDGLFEMAKISVKMVIPIDYPNSRPSVVFETKMFHPNVDYLTGIPCFSMLRQDWHNGYHLEHYLNGLLWFLHNPCFLDPSNPAVAARKSDYEVLLKQALRGETVLGMKFQWARVDEQPVIPQKRTFSSSRNYQFTRSVAPPNNNNNIREVAPPININIAREVDRTPTSSVRDLRSMFERLSRT